MNKKLKFILIILGALAFLVLFIAFIVFRMDEDSWIKDEKGIWIKHGNPSETPNYVLEQQEAISCAIEKFNNLTEEANSQCLGACGNYTVDIVNVPRTTEDNLAENQCEDYASGKLAYFIELDKEGKIVKIA
jgi:hypothetical protein